MGPRPRHDGGPPVRGLGPLPPLALSAEVGEVSFYGMYYPSRGPWARRGYRPRRRGGRSFL